MLSVSVLLHIFIYLCVVGLILWGINSIPGIPPIIKIVISVIVGVLILLWIAGQIGGGHSLGLSLR